MPTPLYTTDVQKITDRTPKTTLGDTDVFVVANASGTLAPITKPNVKTTLGISNAEGEIDDLQTAETAIKGTGWTDENLVDHESRIGDLETNDTLQDATLGTLKETVLSTKLAVNELERQAQIGNGATLDFSGIGTVALDARATGRANPTVEGRTATNIVDGADIANLGTVTFASVLDHKYFDVLHGTILTGTGSDMTVTNDTGTTKDIAVINLTSIYGAGNEPTASDCSKIFSYFDATKSIQLPARVRSVGRNLFDGELEIGRFDNLTGQKIFQSDRIRNVSPIKINPSTVYSASKNGIAQNIAGFYFYDSYKNYIGIGLGGNSTTSPANAYYLNIMLSGTDVSVFANLQIETGSTATPYEPYTDSTLYLADNEELRSVPAISDEVKVVNGQLVKVQNVQRYVLQASDITTFVTSPTLTNVGTAVTRLFADNENWVNDIINLTIYIPANSQIKSSFPGYDTVENVGKFFVKNDNRIYFIVSQTETLTTVKAALAGTVIYYQLATPIITPLTTSGTLQAKPKGTVYFEPYYEGSHQTDASAQITLPYEGTIEAVYGYDEDLVEYLLDDSEYSLAGTTLTITDALENEVWFVKMSRSEPLAPEMSVNTLNNDQVTLDSADGKYYQIGFTTTNGVPTVTATEVV